MYYSFSIRSPDPYLYSKRDGENKLLFLSVTTLQSIDEEVRKTEEVVNNSSLPLTIISITRWCGDGETLWTKYKHLIILICSPRVLR